MQPSRNTLGCIWLAMGILCITHRSAEAIDQRKPLDPTKTVGVESCGECHDEIVEQWEKSAHAKSMDYLAKTEAARSIANILGMEPSSIPTQVSCVRCHYTQEAFSGTPQTTASISCESCHGAADSWIDVHNKKSLSRPMREKSAMAEGMAHPCDVASVSMSCYECHVIDDEQLVNQAGHPAMSEGFELLSWYSGETKHNFLVQKPGKSVKSHASTLQPIPRARMRMLYLTGKMLHLAQSLKAMSYTTDAPVDSNGNFIILANGKYTFGVQHTIQVQRILKDMQEVTEKVQIPGIQRAMAVASNLSYTTGQQMAFSEAAEEIQKLAKEFCKENDGSAFAAIDPILAKLKPRYSKHFPKN